MTERNDGAQTAGAAAAAGGASPTNGTSGSAATRSNSSGGPVTASGASPAAPIPGSSPGIKDWRDALPADLRDAARNFRLPGDAVKAARDLRQKLSTAITVPGDRATPEEIAAFRKRIGVPDSPEGYEVRGPALPEGIDATAASAAQADFLRAMHAAGAPPAAVQAALDWYWGHAGKAAPADPRSAATAAREADAALREAWGHDYDEKLALARRTIADYGGEEFAVQLERSGLGNSVSLARALADLGSYRAEDAWFGGPGAGARNGSADARLHELMSRPDYWTNAAAQSEARAISERLYGTEPIAVAPDR
jgi:hypothetical protein